MELRLVHHRHGILYPMLVVSAVSVIIFCAVGIAALSGLLPDRSDELRSALPETPAHESHASPLASEPIYLASAGCPSCGVIEAVEAFEVKAAGGDNVTAGADSAIATMAGAAGGGIAATVIEQQLKKPVQYQVRVRMDDGTSRTLLQSHKSPAVGEKVKVVNGKIVGEG